MKETFAETNLIENFTPHSYSSASATKAFSMNLNILDILRKACWSNAKTFLQHYKKEIVSYELLWQPDHNTVLHYAFQGLSGLHFIIKKYLKNT